MTFFIIPARNDLPWYQFQITLSGVVFTLVMRYNTRMNRWILDVQDPSGNPILNGVPLLLGISLLSQYPTLPLPDGIMFVTDETGTDSQPTQYSFGLTNTFWFGDNTQ